MANNQSWAIFWLLFLLYMFDYMVIVSHFPYLSNSKNRYVNLQCQYFHSN